MIRLFSFFTQLTPTCFKISNSRTTIPKINPFLVKHPLSNLRRFSAKCFPQPKHILQAGKNQDDQSKSSGQRKLITSMAIGAGILAFQMKSDDKKPSKPIEEKDYQEIKNPELQKRVRTKSPILDLRNLNLSLENFSNLSKWLATHHHHFRRVLFGSIPEEAQSVSNEILRMIQLNFTQYKDRPNPYTCAQFASLAYSNEKVIQTAVLPDGWKYENCKNLGDTSGYFGAAFVHHGMGQIILVHRGTASPWLKSLYADAFGVIKGVVEGQQESALIYTKEVLQKAEKWGYSVGIVGYSLGGWLAQLTACWSVSQGFDDVYAVTIDTPGAKTMLGTYLKGRMIAPMAETSLKNLSLLNYVSIPNHVNSCNEQAGDIHHIIPGFVNPATFKERICASLVGNFEIMSLLFSHKMNYLLDAFDSATGTIKAGRGYAVSHWPDVGRMGKYSYDFFRIIRTNLSDLPALTNLSLEDTYTVREIGQYQVKQLEPNQITMAHFSKQASAWLRHISPAIKSNPQLFGEIEEKLSIPSGELNLCLQFTLENQERTPMIHSQINGWEFRNKVENLIRCYPELVFLTMENRLELSIDEALALIDFQEKDFIKLFAALIPERLYLYAPASEEDIRKHSEDLLRIRAAINTRRDCLKKFIPSLDKNDWVALIKEQLIKLEIMEIITEALRAYKKRDFIQSKNLCDKALPLIATFETQEQTHQMRLHASVYCLKAKIDRCLWKSEEDLKNSAANYRTALDEEKGLAKVATIWSNYGSLLHDWAESLKWEGKTEEAWKKYQEAKEAHKQAHEFALQGDWLHQMMIVDPKKEEGLVSIKRDYGRALFLLAEFEHHQGRISDVEYKEKLLRALTFFPPVPVNSITWLFKGIVLEELKQYREAKHCYEEGLLLNKAHPTLLNRLSGAYLREEDLNLECALSNAKFALEAFESRQDLTREDLHRMKLVKERIAEIEKRMKK